MNNNLSESFSDNKNTKKHYLLVETTEEAIKDFNSSPDFANKNVILSHMYVEGERVPAFKFEVDECETYRDYKQDEWRQEDRYKQENRCIICGANGKSKRCPVRIPNPDYTGAPGQTKTLAVHCEECPYGYQYMFKPIKGKVVFSTLDVTDEEDNTDCYEPGTPENYNSGDIYGKLLDGFIAYINENHPRYSKHTELLSLLADEIDIKEVAEILDMPKSSIYSFLEKARTFYDEYRANVDFI